MTSVVNKSILFCVFAEKWEVAYLWYLLQLTSTRVCKERGNK